MKRFSKGILILLLVFFSVMVFSPSQVMAAKVKKVPATKVNKWDFTKMPDMSDFDPNNPVIPTGDTFKIAVLAPFSGPAAGIGQQYWITVLWAAHDINKRGGLMIDGKKKMIQVLKADMEFKPDVTKKVAERMILQEKVNVLWGTAGSANMKVLNEIANKYKVITIDTPALTDDLYEGANFTRYSFMTCWSSGQIGRGMAYFYGQRKKEKKFYILCQDNLFGHVFGEGFKKGLKEYYPEAEIVGEEYHKMFLPDFAPYIAKIKASGAEVVYTGDFPPDVTNMVKQARQLGVTIPFANIFVETPEALADLGIEGSKGLVQISWYGTKPPLFKDEGMTKLYKEWNNAWKKWKEPYNTKFYEHFWASTASYVEQTYWLFNVVMRAASADPEKIIKVWEGDTYQYANGKIQHMRACDHKTVQDLHVFEYVPPDQQKEMFNIPPYHFFSESSGPGPTFTIPASKIMPRIDPTMDRCKGVK
ncbi:MAG: branched-chain amino acid ABC transporter substrate-binding protein [Deltaproteobacteria bacterium HGW-Deltaproteobacteria-12]|jgi:ABC-type branched-subunit amino acid transport system substrate-binding protein|nr:MAG: branched-chain amino acid ABC transporter substrate-binding protein [Deltaproteobacteria bacterium HGW-Deltaproteobacteria-12]